jgi:hypothetical protein
MAQSGSSGTVRGYGFDMYGSYRSYTANFGVDQSVPPRRGRILVYHHPMHRYHHHAAATAH